MNDLSPNARTLIEQGRSALRPSARDRDRIETALRARLGAEALPADPGASQLVGFAGTRALLRLAVGVCVVGGGIAFLALRPSASPPQSKHAVVAPPSVAAPIDVRVEPEHVPAELAPEAQPPLAAPAPVPAATRKHDPLAREVALLARATQALHLGQPDKALRALDEHQRRFPNGALDEERRAARAQALCRLGRVSEGRAEQAKLQPKSPAAARARQVCEAIAPRAP